MGRLRCTDQIWGYVAVAVERRDVPAWKYHFMGSDIGTDILNVKLRRTKG